MKFLRFNETLTPRFSAQIPGDITGFKNHTPLLKRAVKYLKRHLLLKIFGQITLESHRLPQSAKNVLWINLSSPSLGDSLMDLAGRILLNECKLSLLTDHFTATLYYSDPYFEHVYTVNSSLTNQPFDHILIDSYGTNSILSKIKIAKNITFSGMYGFFDGPEVNKILFSYFRINQLLGDPYPENWVRQNASTHIFPASLQNKMLEHLKLPEYFISIVIGGEWDHRTYPYWLEVIQGINSNINIILIGSHNGIDYAKLIMDTISDISIQNFVGRLSIMETTAVISKSALMLCADGGLMHIAHGCGIPTIALFATVQPVHFTTASNNTTTIYHAKSVSFIKSNIISNHANRLIIENKSCR